LGAGMIVGYLLAFVYLNVYLLIPRLLIGNKWKVYLLIVFLIACICSIFTTNFEASSIFILIISRIIPGISGIIFLFIGTATLVIFQHWARNERYIAQLEAATMRAELEQLQNQINPHFLFNMLNNILVLIRENPEEAVFILHKMSDMLKYQFNERTKKEVLLNDDIQFLTDFLNLEKIRRDHFQFTITVENDAENKFVPPLLFIPFVENAVKHSNDTMNLSYIRLHFSVKDAMLHFSCLNSQPLKPQKKDEHGGLGLVNVRRRLSLLYPEKHLLNIESAADKFQVILQIPYSPNS
jgi:LytS/YehU family sensor histidine kinase